MGADSKHLSRALLLLAKDAHGRGASLRRGGRSAAPATQKTQSAGISLSGGGSGAVTGNSWFLRLSRRWQQNRDRLIGWTEPTQSSAGMAASAELSGAYEKLLRIVADKMTAADAGTLQQSGRGGAQVRHRRWMAFRLSAAAPGAARGGGGVSSPTASSWDFPTLNASFPFTIPSIPVRLFLVASPGTHVGGAVASGGVAMPPGLGTSARKFHSMSLARQPSVPFDNDGSGAAVGGGHMAQAAGAAVRAQIALRGKVPLTTAHRRTEGLGGARTRASKSFMFAHAATGIPKFENRIPLVKDKGRTALRQPQQDGAHKETRYPAAIDPQAEELAASAGEDAFFHRHDALGIADGVGGWAGVRDADPSLFARRLMHHVSVEMQRYDDIDDELFAQYTEAAPVDVLRRAYEATADEMETLAVRGSSTACVVILRGDELRVANLGDCGLTVVRQGDMVFRTEEQQHSFNYPYQLSTEPHSDAASDAQVFRLKIQKGDIVIVGSDGVFDNLFDEDILEEVSHHLPPVMRADGPPELKYSSDSLWYESQQHGANDALSPPKPSVAAAPKFSLPQFHIDPKAISLAIARRAKLVSEDARYTESPFQMRAMQEGLYYQGGKRDDITVVVAVVTDLEDTPDRR
ncbi:hypothetical protein H4217_009051 [Coemansia sp. RSA 1939]|nr:hypothetical protein H4217_009051 [Coemansia sp. RSA 1939]